MHFLLVLHNSLWPDNIRTPSCSFTTDASLRTIFIPSGIGLSLPSAIITRTYAPIMVVGAVGGLIIGFVTKSVVG